MKKHPITDKVLTEKRFLLGLNTQSLRCHHHGFMVEVEIIDEKPKIIALTETWLTKIDKEPVIQSKRGKANLKRTIALLITNHCYQNQGIPVENRRLWILYTRISNIQADRLS